MYRRELIIEKSNKNEARTVLLLGNLIEYAIGKYTERFLQLDVDFIKGDIDINSIIPKEKKKRLEEFLFTIKQYPDKDVEGVYYTVVDGAKDEKIFYDRHALAKYILYRIDEETEDGIYDANIGFYQLTLFSVELD